jgi:divalent metal cation (Fe/Co/Zn/Cd) transporter
MSIELPTAPVQTPPAREAGVSRETWLRLAGRARFLSWLSLGVMSAEAAVAITAGVVASSIALIGFGIDSLIEGVASLIIVWRFSGSRLLSHSAEQRAQRLVAIQFFLLAPYVGVESLRGLLGGHHADISWLGIGLATFSAVTMPALGTAKQRIAEGLGSVATKGEGQQNMLCAYLAGALLLGLLGNALFGLWWLDPVVGLLIAGVAVKEGVESWRGEGCCAPGALSPPEPCQDDCCAD